MNTKLLTALVLCLGLGNAAHANLLTNAGFETGTFAGWQTSGNAGILECAGTNIGCAPGGGDYFGSLNGNTLGVGSGSVRQTVTLSGPGTYQFGAYVSFGTTNAAGNFEQGQISFTIQVAGGPSETVGFDPNALNGQFTIPGGLGFSFTPWFLLSDVLTYAGAGPVDALFNINVQDFSSTNTLVLAFDNAFVQAAGVPEPASLALLGLGLAGLGFARRRRTA